MINSYTVSWKNISIRINALLSASNTLFNALKIENTDNNANSHLYKEFVKVYEEIQKFISNFKESLPEHIANTLNNFIKYNHEKFEFNLSPSMRKANLNEVKPIIILLASLEAEVSFFINDTQAHIIKSVEVAFAHLQRLLIVDKTYQAKWQECRNEPEFEKLGGVHLLLHKIWAFKVDGGNERTDLALSTPIQESDPLLNSVDGLVLTEWKKHDLKKHKNDYSALITEAKKQALLYTFGSLYALELSNYCYLVIVSEKSLNIPLEACTFSENNIKFRVINIAYNPNIPSVESKKQTNKS